MWQESYILFSSYSAQEEILLIKHQITGYLQHKFKKSKWPIFKLHRGKKYKKLIEEEVEDSHIIFDALKEVDLNKSLLLLSRENNYKEVKEDEEDEDEDEEEEDEEKLTTGTPTQRRKFGVAEIDPTVKRQRKLGISERDELERFLVCQIIKMSTINKVVFEFCANC